MNDNRWGMNDERPENLGRMGEIFFETLCKNAGYVANRSEDDKCGWDFEVEHPGHEASLYRNQSHPVYRVQVKATATNKEEIPLTYSNLLSLIRYSGASFIFLVKYKKKQMYPYHAYLIHVDEEFAIDVHKSMRKTQIRDSQFSLNKRKRIVKFTESEKISPLNGTELRKAFNKSIAGGYLKYVEQKTSYLKRLEEEGQLKEFILTLKSESDLNDMVDCLLGYNKQFKVDTASYEAPFGLRDSEPYSVVENHVTTIRPQQDEQQKATVYLKNSKYGKAYKFDGVVYTVPPPLSHKVKKIRIETPLFDFIIDNDRRPSLSGKDIMNEDIKVPFRAFYNFLCFLNATGQGMETFIRFEDSRAEKSVELSLGISKGGLPPDFPAVFRAVEATYKKLRELNLDEKTLSTCSVWRRFNSFNLFCIMGNNYEPSYVLDFQHAGSDCEYANVILFQSSIELQDVILTLFVAFFGKIEKISHTVMRGFFYRSEFMGECILDSSTDNESYLKNESDRYEAELLNRGFKVLY